MAWIYLAESAESRSPWNLGSKQLPTVKSTNTAKPYYCPECQKEKSHSHPFGMTCGHYPNTTSTNESKSTLYQRASHARTSLMLALEKAWKASAENFFTKLSGLPKKLIRRLYLPKHHAPQNTHTFFVMRLEKLDILQEPALCPPQRSEPPLKAEDSLFCPRPCAIDVDTRVNQGGAQGRIGKKRLTLGWIGANWSRPQARDYKDAANPMPHGKHSDSIGVAVHLNDHKGYLNPAFHAAMMGYDTEWNVLNALGMEWYESR